MMYLEMSRNEAHGGGTWAFTNCVWAPTEKKGGGKWPFWTKILDIRIGDMVLHLRGVRPNAEFIGYSRASSDGFETNQIPPDPGVWNYSKKFYRADLEEFTPFHKPINLEEVFSEKQSEIENYFNSNKSLSSGKLNIFFVHQNNRLQCLNGAYLSDVDDKLFDTLFTIPSLPNIDNAYIAPISVETGSQLTVIKARRGQSDFAKEIKKLYKNKCCFPGCLVSDSRFLVASHIARWSDNETLRGEIGNGLCFCLIHDKAFELGLFTLDENFKIYVNPKEFNKGSQIANELQKQQGQPIKLGSIYPLLDALLEHWVRVDIDPFFIPAKE